MARKHGRVDANQAEIVEAALKLGCHIHSLANLGSGCADLLVRLPDGRLALWEVKRPKVGKWTKAQEAWRAVWPVTRVESVEDVVRIVTKGAD